MEAETIMFSGDDVQLEEEERSDDWDEEQPARKRRRLDMEEVGPRVSEHADMKMETPAGYRLRRMKSTCIQS